MLTRTSVSVRSTSPFIPADRLGQTHITLLGQFSVFNFFLNHLRRDCVRSPGITSTRFMKFSVCFQWTIRKAVAWSFK